MSVNKSRCHGKSFGIHNFSCLGCIQVFSYFSDHITIDCNVPIERLFPSSINDQTTFDQYIHNSAILSDYWKKYLVLHLYNAFNLYRSISRQSYCSDCRT